MARLARVIAPGLPHHVTQRGNRREPIFFEDGDQEVYRDLLAEQTRRRSVAVWAYCLMPNHVHLVLAPSDEAGLGLAVGDGRTGGVVGIGLVSSGCTRGEEAPSVGFADTSPRGGNKCSCFVLDRRDPFG